METNFGDTVTKEQRVGERHPTLKGIVGSVILVGFLTTVYLILN